MQRLTPCLWIMVPPRASKMFSTVSGFSLVQRWMELGYSRTQAEQLGVFYSFLSFSVFFCHFWPPPFLWGYAELSKPSSTSSASCAHWLLVIWSSDKASDNASAADRTCSALSCWHTWWPKLTIAAPGPPPSLRLQLSISSSPAHGPALLLDPR